MKENTIIDKFFASFGKVGRGGGVLIEIKSIYWV